MCIFNYNKKEWNLVVLTIVSSLDYEERILSYLCRDGPSLKNRLHPFFKILNTYSINPKLKKRLIKKFEIKQLVIIFTEGGKHKIITQAIS